MVKDILPQDKTDINGSNVNSVMNVRLRQHLTLFTNGRQNIFLFLKKYFKSNATGLRCLLQKEWDCSCAIAVPLKVPSYIGLCAIYLYLQFIYKFS